MRCVALSYTTRQVRCVSPEGPAGGCFTGLLVIDAIVIGRRHDELSEVQQSSVGVGLALNYLRGGLGFGCLHTAQMPQTQISLCMCISCEAPEASHTASSCLSQRKHDCRCSVSSFSVVACAPHVRPCHRKAREECAATGVYKGASLRAPTSR